ncbi:MAG: winged helix-turn-helix transcriptional regulator [Lawsonibacter sp.]
MLMEHENCPCMETCPLNRAMALIGGKWKMQILYSLYNNGPTRYNQLKKALDGVSNTVLANALRELEGDGLVHRQEYLEVPVRVEYAITEPCRRLIPILDALGGWSTAPSRRKKAAGGACGQDEIGSAG